MPIASYVYDNSLALLCPLLYALELGFLPFTVKDQIVTSGNAVLSYPLGRGI